MRLVMMGTGSFAEPTMQALLSSRHQVIGLVTQPDRITGKERGSTRQARRGMKELAEEHGIPVFQPESINTPAGIEQLAKWQPDLLVVAAYGQILSKDVLAVAGKKGINVHASLLPKYRGAAPIAWAIYHGETETGVTIIRMSITLDAGDLLAQEATSIGPEETAGELEARLAPMGARLALAVIEQIAADTSKGMPQDKTQATKAPKLTKEHGLIDWSRSPREVCNHVRAMQPWPTAYTFLRRPSEPPLRLLVVKASPRHQAAALLPGIISADAAEPGLVVGAGHGGVVEILELQPAGKRRMAAREFLRGNVIQSGWTMGGESP